MSLKNFNIALRAYYTKPSKEELEEAANYQEQEKHNWMMDISNEEEEEMSRDYTN